MANLQLYVDSQYASPWAMSCFIALQEKFIPADITPVDLGAAENKSPEFARKSRTQRIPALVDGDFSLSESTAICEYLEDNYPDFAILPRDKKNKALARQVQAWIRSDLIPLRNERPTEVIFYRKQFEPLSNEALAAAQKLFSVVDTLLVTGAENLFGEWSIADSEVALMLQRLLKHGDPLPPHLAAYAENQWRRPSVRLWLDLQRPALI